MPYKQKDIDGCTEEFQVNASSCGGISRFGSGLNRRPGDFVYLTRYFQAWRLIDGVYNV